MSTKTSAHTLLSQGELLATDAASRPHPGAPKSTLQAPRRDRWSYLLLTFLLLLLFSWLGIRLSRQSEGVATIWFTNGMLFAIVISKPRAAWLRYFAIGILADTLADIIWGDPFHLSIGVALANSVEVVSSAFLLTYFFGHPFNLSKRRPLLGFLAVAVIGATAIASALGASWTLLFVDAGPWWQLFRTWYLGDILGMAVIAPLIFILMRPGFFAMLRPAQLRETLLFLTIPTVATTLVFLHSHDPLIFFIFPALMLIVFRLGFPGTVLTIFIIACISIGLTVTGHGPLMLITGAKMLHRIVVMQIFLAVALFTAFPVAALLEERKELELSLQKSEAKYRILANADSLTGLANRRAFDERLESEWRRAMREKQPISLLLIDVDLFKVYNDIYGHLDGDRCLCLIATEIANTAKPHTDTATRYGGEEFAVILPNTQLEPALAIAESIRHAIEAMHLSHPGSNICGGIQTISVGVASAIPCPDDPPLSLLRACDRALYSAKDHGRNRVESAASFPSPSNLEASSESTSEHKPAGTPAFLKQSF
jgi:diguanylate cyclase (GGDEF)-like protein